MGKKAALEWDDDALDRLADKIAERIKADSRWQPYRPYWWQSPVTSTWREG